MTVGVTYHDRLLLLLVAARAGRVWAPRAADVCRRAGVPEDAVRAVESDARVAERRAAAAEAMYRAGARVRPTVAR